MGSRLDIFLILICSEFACKLEPPPDQVYVSLRSCNSWRRLLLESMQHVNRFSKCLTYTAR